MVPKTIYDVISIGANILTIFASVIAICLFLSNRDDIKSILNVLLNYSFNITFSEITSKLDRINDLNADDEGHRNKILNILNEIKGQICGNGILKKTCGTNIKTIDKYTKDPKKFKETSKRSLVAEIREKIKNIGVDNYKITTRSKKWRYCQMLWTAHIHPVIEFIPFKQLSS